MNKLFPLDRYKFEDLEIFPGGQGKVSFTQGYYYCPAIPKDSNTVKFYRITHTFNPIDERPTKFFQLEKDKPKHFYFKITPADEPLNIDYVPLEESEVPEDLYRKDQYYAAKSVEISDDIICQEGDLGYPFVENYDRLKTIMPQGQKSGGTFYGNTLEDQTEVFTENMIYPGPLNKTEKVFYIYFCSLLYDDEGISRVDYYMTRASFDPSIVIPKPIKRIINNNSKSMSDNLKKLDMYDSIGQKYLGEDDIYGNLGGQGDSGNFFSSINIPASRNYRRRNSENQSTYIDSSYDSLFIKSAISKGPSAFGIPDMISSRVDSQTPKGEPEKPIGSGRRGVFTHDSFTISPMPILITSYIQRFEKFTAASE